MTLSTNTFTGEYRYSLDTKGRINIPAKFRQSLSNDNQNTFIATRGQDPCIWIYPLKEWKKIEDEFTEELKKAFSIRDKQERSNMISEITDKAKDSSKIILATDPDREGEAIAWHVKDFLDEKKLLNNYKNINFFDHQGTHFAPHLVSLNLWNKVGGFSEEFNPGIGSDPDLNMKLWNAGVRIFKGVSRFRVYHFGSIVLRKKKNFRRNKGSRTFLLK